MLEVKEEQELNNEAENIMPEVIRFENVDKIYKLSKNNEKKNILNLFFKNKIKKDKKVLDNLSFTIHKGERVVILGKNGCGKSTILKLITNVTYPTNGKVIVNEKVNALLELNSGFEQEFTGRENIYLKGTLLGLNKEQIKQVEDDIVNFADIGEYIDYPVQTYSSGMRARLGFSIAINIKPEILVVDEALSVGDQEFKEKCLEKINEITSGKAVTLVFVTHSFEMARQFCDRGIFIKDGKIAYDGTVKDALHEYNAFLKGKK